MKRIIKNENETLIYKNINIKPIKPGEYSIHPISLGGFENVTNKTLCLTKYNIKNNKLELTNNYNCSDNNFNQYMHIPPVGLRSDDILEIYKISSVDELKLWIDNNTNLSTINRVINCWLRVNYETLKVHNVVLYDIFINLFNKYKNNLDLNKLDLEKEIKYYIEYWIYKTNATNFNFDLYNDMIKYLNKKNKK
jgi:hypothetical protein